MLYVFHGTDLQMSGKKARALVDSLRKKKPDASYVAIDADSWTPSIVEEHLGGQGLFANKYIIFLDRVAENIEAREALGGMSDAMQESANIFIVLDGKLNAELSRALVKGAEKAVVTDLIAQQGAPKEEFNIFALADAIGGRKSLDAWFIYRKAIDRGTEPENIVGTIFWQLKSMALAAEAGSASEAGLSPFVFSKAKRALANYSAEELNRLTEKVINVYHEGHRGKIDMELAVERALLGLQ